MSEKIDKRVEKYLDRAANIFFADHITTLEELILDQVDKTFGEAQNHQDINIVLKIAELIQREEFEERDRDERIESLKLSQENRERLDIMLRRKKVKEPEDPNLVDPSSRFVQPYVSPKERVEEAISVPKEPLKPKELTLYKVGDRVKVINDNIFSSWVSIGDEAIVNSIEVTGFQGDGNIVLKFDKKPYDTQGVYESISNTYIHRIN